jgi:hypothetical protein
VLLFSIFFKKNVPFFGFVQVVQKWFRWFAGFPAPHFTCFIGTKVQILTQKPLLDRARTNEQAREIAEQVMFHLLRHYQ